MGVPRSATCSIISATVVPTRNLSVSDSVPAAACAAAKKRTVTSIWAARVGVSATDGAHRPGGLNETGVVDAVAGRLGPHRDAPRGLDHFVVGTTAEQTAKVGLLAREQAAADLTVGGQPGAVTRRTEGV